MWCLIAPRQEEKFGVGFGVTLNQKPSQLVITEKALDIRGRRMNDTEYAIMMQNQKAELFKNLSR